MNHTGSRPEHSLRYKRYSNAAGSIEALITPAQFNELVPGKIADLWQDFRRDITARENQAWMPSMTHNIDGSLIAFLPQCLPDPR